MKECSNDTIAELFPKVTSKVHKRWVTQDMMELDGRAEKCIPNLMEGRRIAKNSIVKCALLGKMIEKKCNKATEIHILPNIKKLKTTRSATQTTCTKRSKTELG